jgi:hypothetical protein
VKVIGAVVCFALRSVVEKHVVRYSRITKQIRAFAKSLHMQQSKEAPSIKLGVEPRAISTGRGMLRDLLALMSHNAEPQPVPATASAEPALLLTEADFAPPENVLPVLMRIAAFIGCGIAAGAVAYLVVSLIV